jgi:hypothetical protein
MAVNDVDFARLGRKMTITAKRMEGGVEALIRKIALTADQIVVQETPVDTGRAKSNWIATIGAPSTTPIPAYDEGDQGSTAAANEQQAYDQAAAVIAGYRLGQTICMSNSLPYIGRLNDGYSAQAPAEYVQEAIVKASLAVTGFEILNPRITRTP